jgi:hypothetical protein
LKALDAALYYGDFVGDVGPLQQGLRAHPTLWTPRTWGEWFEAYREGWGLLWQRTPTLPNDERTEAVRILLSRARGLTAIANLSSMVCQTLRELADEPYVDKQRVLSTVISIRKRYVKDMPSENREAWERLENDLTGQDFTALIHRYVGMDLLVDKFDEQGNRVGRVQPQIGLLADQALLHPELLEAELPWLFSGGAANAGRFGYALGQRDPDLTLYPCLLTALRQVGPERNGLLVGAYMRALFEKDGARWEAELDALVADPELKPLVLEFTYRADLSDRAAKRLLELARDGTMQPSDFQMFGYTVLRSQISPNTFHEWIDFLLGRLNLAATLTALQVYDAYYSESRDDAMPDGLAERLLLHESLFQPTDDPNDIVMGEYYWEKLAQSFLTAHPERGPVVAAKILEHLADDSFVSRHEHESLTVLNLATSHPTEDIWRIIAGYLGPPIDRRAWRIKDWLSGGGFFGERIPGALVRMPADQVWAWVDEHVEQRAWYLATFVPNILFHDLDRTCWARELLVRYGDRDDVRNNLAANFSTGGWVGEESEYLSQKRNSLAEFLLQETHTNVRRWVGDYIAHLERAIEESRIWEEREGF